jgi:predicted permease
MLQDLRHGVRMLLQNKGWTIVIVLSLALGIGANTAIFSGVNGLLLQPLPVTDPERLVRLRTAGPNEMGTDFSDYGSSDKTASGEDVRSTFPYPMFLEFQKANRTLDGLFACAPRGQSVVLVDGQADTASSFAVSGSYYHVLGVDALIGRTILPEDDNVSATPVAVISESFWKRRFGGSSQVVGKVVQVNNAPVTIVGVAPAWFTGVQQAIGTAADVTIPLSLALEADTAGGLRQATTWWLQVMGRLNPGVAAAQVEGNLAGLFQENARAGWSNYLAALSERERSSARNQNRIGVPRLIVDSGSRGIYDPPAQSLRSVTILGVVVVLLLLIVCANVANLLLSRATARQREISVRLSLGARRARLVRQLLTESILLAFIGGAAGLLVGYWSRQLLPINTTVAFDWRLFLFVATIAAAAGIGFGIAPALRATRVDLNATLKEGSRSVIRSRSLLSKVLTVIQVAMSLVLLVGAGLFLTTLNNLRRVDVGFDANNLLLFRMDPGLNRYEQTRIATLYQQTIERLQTVPGVRSVSLSQPGLLSGSTSSTSVYIEGRTYSQRGDSIYQVTISPKFFGTMGIPLLAGRVLTDRDDDKAPKVVVINDTAAKKYFPGENPIGRRFGREVENRTEWEIVGVVRDAKYNSLRDAPPPTVYWPYLQRCCPRAVFEVRTAGNPASFANAVREAVRQVDPNIPLMNVATQMENIEGRISQEKLFAQAYALFGVLALLLASIGLFGLMSYNVTRRTNEIGIRMALGAQRRDVLGLVMKESMLLVLIGMIIGLAAAVATGRLITTMLFGLSPADPRTILVAIAIMAVVSAVAGYLPARRASKVDPMIALHYE